MISAYGAVSGTIAAQAAAVTNANTIADFQGEASVNLVIDHASWKGQNIFIQDDFLHSVDATMNFSEVAFDPNTIGTVWGITATVYTFDTSLTTVPELEWLATVERGNDDANQLFQIWAGAGRIAADFPISMTHGEYITHDIGIQLFTDADNKLIELIWET